MSRSCSHKVKKVFVLFCLFFSLNVMSSQWTLLSSQVKYAAWKHPPSLNVEIGWQDAGQQEIAAVIQMKQDVWRVVAVKVRRRGWIWLIFKKLNQQDLVIN